jgi:hypothetical protein
MFSQLGPIFKTIFRQAESADARLEIRRDEKQDGGRKHEEDTSEEEPSPLWTDSASVSVEALRAFLIEFLKSKGDESASTYIQVSTEAAAIDVTATKPANAISAKAVKAYTALEQPPAPPLPEESLPPASEADLLASEEVRTIHWLIHELDALSRQGVTMLSIDKAETFLQSLVDAVTAIKNL